jgi:hypothetical protein
VNLQENVNPDLLTSMREGVPSQLTGIPVRRDHENDAIPKIAPKWLKYDRQVSNNNFCPPYLIKYKLYLII